MLSRTGGKRTRINQVQVTLPETAVGGPVAGCNIYLPGQ